MPPIKKTASAESGTGKRTWHTGTVRQLKSGRWQARWPRWIDPKQRNIWFGIEMPDDTGFGGTYETREDAQEALVLAVERYRDHRLDLSHLGEPDVPTDPEVAAVSARTVRDAVRALLDEAPPHGQPGSFAVDTVINIESALRRHIAHPKYGIADAKVATLTQADLYAWWRLMERDIELTGSHGNGHAIRKRVFSYVRLALSHEVKAGRLPSNPAIGMTLASRRKSEVRDQREITIPPLSDQWKLIHAIPREGDRLLALSLMWGGPRFSELAGADVDALDNARKTVTLRHQWRRIKGDGARKPTWVRERLKTGRTRTMLLPTPLFDAIWDWRENRRVKPVPPRKNVLFPYLAVSGQMRPSGVGVWTPSEWNREIIRPYRVTAGLDEFTEKQWRAGCASLWDDAGFRLIDIQRQLGHAPGSQITAMHYLKALEDKRDRDREEIRHDSTLTPQHRLDRLYEVWVRQNGDPLQGAQ